MMRASAVWRCIPLGILLGIGLGCSGKSSGEGVCPDGVISIVGSYEWTTIESAISARWADEEGEVQLCPGTFESRTLLSLLGDGSERIMLRGHPDGTVLNGNGEGPVFDITGDGVVELSDLTVTNGYADSGGGGYRGRGNQILILDNVRFEDNVAEEDGGAIRLYADDEGSVTLEDGGSGGTVFEGNQAGEDGGAIALYGEGFASFNPGTWTFTANTAGGRGGAVTLQSGATVSMFGDLVATGNQADDEGGVLFIGAASAPGMVLGRIDAVDNRAGAKGGVIRLADGGTGDLTISSGAIERNSALDGGALAATRGWSLAVASTSFVENAPQAVLYAGESYTADALGSAFACTADAGCSPTE